MFRKYTAGLGTRLDLGVQGEQNLKDDTQVCELYTWTDSGVIQRWAGGLEEDQV